MESENLPKGADGRLKECLNRLQEMAGKGSSSSQATKIEEDPSLARFKKSIGAFSQAAQWLAS